MGKEMAENKDLVLSLLFPISRCYFNYHRVNCLFHLRNISCRFNASKKILGILSLNSLAGDHPPLSHCGIYRKKKSSPNGRARTPRKFLGVRSSCPRNLEGAGPALITSSITDSLVGGYQYYHFIFCSLLFIFLTSRK